MRDQDIAEKYAEDPTSGANLLWPVLQTPVQHVEICIWSYGKCLFEVAQ